MPARAAILLAFANDWVDDKRHLRSLLEESKAISKALAPLVDTGRLGLPPPLHNATIDDVIDAFRARRDHGRIRVFHFGGHASGSTLLFEDDAGRPTQAHAAGLAGYLGCQHDLMLVFLNGCCTEPQVRRLREAGVRAVVATTRAIQDEVAAEFAKVFYAELATRSLRDAFDTAAAAMRLRWGDDPQAVTRDVVAHDEPAQPAWPWVIDCDSGVEAWTLSAETAHEPATWRRRLGVAVAAMSLLLTASLVVSAEARRTTCRAPGLRSLCAVVGIGHVPTPAEQAMWGDALTQRSGDGLRSYLRTYPDGAYVDEARTRLDGCTIDRVETLEPEKNVIYHLPVIPNHANPLPTKDEARREAQARGNQDAKTYCETLRTTAEILSTWAEPSNWKCIPLEHGFTCGFDDEIVCHVRYRIRSAYERCR